jgi:hypothetical protein
MPDTVSNQNRTVVHKGSTHTAVATEPDVCKVPPGIPTPFENTVPSTRLTSNTTTQTFIQNNVICIQGTYIGPLSDSAHAGVLGGVTSSTYRMEAEATSWSRDVLAEGKGVVRTNDTTTQNHGNTSGIVVAGFLVAAEQGFESLASKKCRIEPLRGVCDHGRELGWPTPTRNGDPEYLEILADDEVLFHTIRKDITKTPHEIEPPCAATGHTHTYWKAEAIQFPLRTKKTMEQEGGTQFEVPGLMAIVAGPLVEALGLNAREIPQIKQHDEPMKPMSQAEADRIWQERYDRKMKKAGSGGSPARQARKERKAEHAADQTLAEKRQKHANENKPATVQNKIEVDLRDILSYWLWRAMPPTISVSATGCSGTRKATLKVYPHRTFEFNFGISSLESWGGPMGRNLAQGRRSPLDNALAALARVKGATDILAKLGELGGYTLKVKLLDGFKFKWQIKYVENTETKGFFRSKQYTPATVGRDWRIEISAAPLVGAEAKWYISLFNFVVPAMGQAVGNLLRRARIVRGDIEVGGKIEMPLGVSFGKDHYDYPKFNGVFVGCDLEIWAALILGVAGAEVEFAARFPAVARGYFNTSDKPGTLIEMTPLVSVRTELTITVCAWGWIRWEIATARPQWLSYRWTNSGQPMDVFASSD